VAVGGLQLHKNLASGRNALMDVRKALLSTGFVALLVVPSVFGAIPLKIYLPNSSSMQPSYISLAVPEAEARNRNTANNRLRGLRVPTNRANFTQSFAPARHTYTINLRENIARVQIQPTRGNNGQSIRHRIDRRPPFFLWQEGNWSRWRTGNAANNRITVSVPQGQERRLRIAVRDRARNVRNYVINIRRASTNTYAQFLHEAGGEFNRRFARNVMNYNLRIGSLEAAGVSLQAAHGNAQIRTRVGSGAWSSFRRGNVSVSPNVRQGQTVRVQFQIRGAFSNLAASPTRTRIYAINITRNTSRVEAQQSAREWLRLIPLSRQGLLSVLMNIERFSAADANFAVDNIGANWNNEAARAARLFIAAWPNMSRAGMIDLLVQIERFTPAQAEFAVNSIGLRPPAPPSPPTTPTATLGSIEILDFSCDGDGVVAQAAELLTDFDPYDLPQGDEDLSLLADLVDSKDLKE